jgi:hypothetical protein
MAVHSSHGPDGSHGTGYRTLTRKRRTRGPVRLIIRPGNSTYRSRVRREIPLRPLPAPCGPKVEGYLVTAGSIPAPARAPRRSGPPGRSRPVIDCQTVPHGEHRAKPHIRKAGKPRRGGGSKSQGYRAPAPFYADPTFPATRYPVIRRHGTSSTVEGCSTYRSRVRCAPLSVPCPPRAGRRWRVTGRPGSNPEPARAPRRSGPNGVEVVR